MGADRGGSGDREGAQEKRLSKPLIALFLEEIVQLLHAVPG